MIINVVCAIIFFENKVLVVQRSAQMKMPLKWEFPGGKVESDESEVDCIKREIKEELNIEIEVGEKLITSLFHYPDFTINLIPFTAHYLSGEIKLFEHSQYKLLKIDELAYLDWAEADIPIARELQTTYRPT